MALAGHSAVLSRKWLCERWGDRVPPRGVRDDGRQSVLGARARQLPPHVPAVPAGPSVRALVPVGCAGAKGRRRHRVPRTPRACEFSETAAPRVRRSWDVRSSPASLRSWERGGAGPVAGCLPSPSWVTPVFAVARLARDNAGLPPPPRPPCHGADPNLKEEEACSFLELSLLTYDLMSTLVIFEVIPLCYFHS